MYVILLHKKATTHSYKVSSSSESLCWPHWGTLNSQSTPVYAGTFEKASLQNEACTAVAEGPLPPVACSGSWLAEASNLLLHVGCANGNHLCWVTRQGALCDPVMSTCCDVTDAGKICCTWSLSAWCHTPSCEMACEEPGNNVIVRDFVFII